MAIAKLRVSGRHTRRDTFRHRDPTRAEERHGFPGTLRTLGGLGAISGPPVLSEDSVLLETAVDRAARDAQRLGRRFLVVLEHGERLEDELALDVGQRR